MIITNQWTINALKCKSLACSAFLKQRSRNSEQAQISSYMYMLAHVFFSSYNNYNTEEANIVIARAYNKRGLVTAIVHA